MQSIDQIRDPVARARAQMSAEILQIRLHLSEAEDAEEIAELEADLDRVESHVASLNMCFL